MQPAPHHAPFFAPWMRWTVMLLLVAGAAIAGWLYATSAKPEEKKRPPSPIRTAMVAHKNVPLYLSGLGTVQAYNTVTVRTRVDGQLMALPFVEGQEVHAGDVLAQLDARPFKAQFDQALATKAKDTALLANARHDLERYKSLGDGISAQIRDTAEATVKQLEATVAGDKAAVESAQTQLDYATITAPMDGRTGIRQVDVGNIIHAGDANGIVTLAQMEPVSVLFSLPQQQLGAINTQLASGAKLTVEALASDNRTVIDTGVLELVDNAIDQTTGSIKLKATFPNHTRQLWPGGFANVRMLLATHADAMTIPTVAIQRGPQGAYVFVYQPESATVALTVVEAGISNGEETEILKGLREGDAVVVDGMAKLQDKSKVVKSDKGEERGKGEKSGKSVEDEKEEKSIKSEKSEKAPPPANEKPVTDLAEKSNDKKPHGGE